MGQYAERIEASRKYMSPEYIRAAKCMKSKERNATRTAVKREAAETRNAKTLPQNRREYRRVNKLKEFAESP